MKHKFDTFADYWEWARNASQDERKAWMRSATSGEQKKLMKDYEENWLNAFEVAHRIKSLSDYMRWSKDKSHDERVKVVSAMPKEILHSMMKERTKISQMKTPRYELRFANGDVMLTNSPDFDLSATANLVVDHLSKTVTKNRNGSNGPDAYAKIFPTEDKKHVNKLTFSIAAVDVHLEPNGDNLEVWRGEELVSIIKSDGLAQFDVWRLLSRLSRK